MSYLGTLENNLNHRKAVTAFLRNLNSNQLYSLVHDLEARFYWEKKQPNWYAGETRRFQSKLRQEYRRFKKSLRNNSAPPEFTSLGSVIIRRSFGPGDAYAYQRLFLQAPEWKELAGYQNDWMKGCWLNKPELRICLYTEGDVTELICDTEDQFEAELDAIRRF